MESSTAGVRPGDGPAPRPAVLNPPLVLNLYAGPGAGKSTTAALTFGKLKLANVRCELVTEYAKDLVWEGATKKFADKSHITMEQLWRQQRLVGEVDVIITDSPLMLGLVYGRGLTAAYRTWLREAYEQFDNLNLFLKRDELVHPYQEYGREQKRADALLLDDAIRTMLRQERLPFYAKSTDGEYLADALRDLVKDRLALRRGDPPPSGADLITLTMRRVWAESEDWSGRELAGTTVWADPVRETLKLLYSEKVPVLSGETLEVDGVRYEARAYLPDLGKLLARYPRISAYPRFARLGKAEEWTHD